MDLVKAKAVIVDSEDIESQLHALIEDSAQLSTYFYSAYFVDEPDEHAWILHMRVSDVDRYNEISVLDIVTMVRHCIYKGHSDSKRVVAFVQPSVQTVLTVAEPLIHHEATEQHRYWSELEVEDLRQLCRLTILELYNKGFYVNAVLIKRSFRNAVLVSLRKQRYRPQLVYLDAMYSKSQNDESIERSELIPDEKAQQPFIDFEEDDLTQARKKTIINEIGQRQYDQLLLEYTTNTSSAWARNLMMRLKERHDGHNRR